MSFHNDLSHLAIKGQNTSYRQLFPYLYLGESIKVDEQVITNCFIQVPESLSNNDDPTNTFNQLAQAKEQQQRATMQRIAVSFINSPQFIRTNYQLGNKLRLLLYTSFDELNNTTDIQSVMTRIFGDAEAYVHFVQASAPTIDNVWLSVIAMLTELDYELYWLERLLILVKKLNIMSLASPYISKGETIPAPMIEAWHQANLLLPESLFPLPSLSHKADAKTANNTIEPHASDDNMSEYQFVRPYAIGTLHLIKYKLIGYELGELKKVENLLQGETREVYHRQTENQQQLHDNTVGDLSEQQVLGLQQEQDFSNQIQQTLAQRKSTTSIDKLSTNYAASHPSLTASGSWTIDDRPAGGHAENNNQFIKDILAETKQRVSENIHSARQSKQQLETELNQLHKLSNTTDNNINGFYYWLNKTYQISAEDAQKRLLIEVNFALDDGEVQQLLGEQGQLTVTPPKTLSDMGIHSFEDIAIVTDSHAELPQNNYLNLCQQFEVNDPISPPQAAEYLAKTIKSESKVSATELTIPPGLQLQAAKIIVALAQPAEVVEATIAGTAITMKTSPAEQNESKSLSKFVGQLDISNVDAVALTKVPVAVIVGTKSNQQLSQYSLESSESTSNQSNAGINQVTTETAIQQSISIQLQLTRTEQALTQWRFALYNQLKAGYQKQFEQYQSEVDRLNQWIAANDTTKTQALINNYLVKKCMHKMYLTAMAKTGKDPASPIAELPYNQYFNHALDWPNMYCKLFEKPTTTSANSQITSTKPALLQLDSELYLTRFLTATHAKVLVPVSTEQEISFIYFIDTGRIWHGDERLAPVNPIALPIVSDFKNLSAPSNRTRSESQQWTVTLPTTMSVLSDREHLNNIGRHLDDQL